MIQAAPDPREHDEAEALLFRDLAGTQDRKRQQEDRLHRMARDREGWTRGRKRRWMLDMAAVLEKLHDSGRWDEHSLSHGCTPRQAADLLKHHSAVIRRILADIDAAEAIWREHLWSRFILCQSSNGHIHNYHGCSTLRPTSRLQWHPEFSGKTEAEAVAMLGPILCSVCFPGAPSEYKRDPAQWRRERDSGERAAAKAEREAKKAIKNLREDEQFRDDWGDLVTTVAACKTLLRRDVELRDFYGQGEHPRHATAVTAARKATAVLLAREERQEGTGASQQEIDQIISRAVRRNRKDGARI